MANILDSSYMSKTFQEPRNKNNHYFSDKSRESKNQILVPT